jgi:hypothetical protein
MNVLPPNRKFHRVATNFRIADRSSITSPAFLLRAQCETVLISPIETWTMFMSFSLAATLVGGQAAVISNVRGSGVRTDRTSWALVVVSVQAGAQPAGKAGSIRRYIKAYSANAKLIQ